MRVWGPEWFDDLIDLKMRKGEIGTNGSAGSLFSSICTVLESGSLCLSQAAISSYLFHAVAPRCFHWDRLARRFVVGDTSRNKPPNLPSVCEPVPLCSQGRRQFYSGISVPRKCEEPLLRRAVRYWLSISYCATQVLTSLSPLLGSLALFRVYRRLCHHFHSTRTLPTLVRRRQSAFCSPKRDRFASNV